MNLELELKEWIDLYCCQYNTDWDNLPEVAMLEIINYLKADGYSEEQIMETINKESCVHCGSHEVTYHQYIGDSYCSECGEWQTE